RSSTLKRLRSLSWRQPTFNDGRIKNFVGEGIDCRAPGYPRLASLENSDESFVHYRRFGYLHNRLLLHRQAEIALLEKRLDELDARDVDSDLAFRLHEAEFQEGDDPEQKNLLEKLEEKLKKYGMYIKKNGDFLDTPSAKQIN